jgi:hypothetical protein
LIVRRTLGSLAFPLPLRRDRRRYLVEQGAVRGTPSIVI